MYFCHYDENEEPNSVTPCTNIRIQATVTHSQTIAQTVTPIGQNRYWAGRVYEGSDFTAPCQGYTDQGAPQPLSCQYITDYRPFGSIPMFMSVNNPVGWDGISGIAGNQPLFYYPPTIDPLKNNPPRMGQEYAISSLMRLWAQSYGVWEWATTSDTTGYYRPVENLDWTPPNTKCAGNVRPAPPGDWCGVRPDVTGIKVQGAASGNVTINGSGFANLTFNSIVDLDQAPLVLYAISWGDEEMTTVSGVEMRPRPSENNPHSVYHLYSYWDLLAKKTSVPTSPINCLPDCSTAYGVSGPCCAVRPSVKIKDNWGWCSSNNINYNGICANDASDYVFYGNGTGYIVVTRN